MSLSVFAKQIDDEVVHISICHVTNALNLKNRKDHNSYLYYSGPYTFLSMINAKKEAIGKIHEYRNILFSVNITLCSAHLKGDDDVIPNGVTILKPHITRTVKTEYSDAPEFVKLRKANKPIKNIPFIHDILQSAYNYASNDHFIIYTNFDIGVALNFYIRIAKFIIDGYKGFTINRRCIDKEILFQKIFENTADFMQMNNKYKNKSVEDYIMDQIYEEIPNGEVHRGFDCFVFERKKFVNMSFGDTFIGFGPIGSTMRNELSLAYKGSGKFRSFQSYENLTFHLGTHRTHGKPNTAEFKLNCRLANERNQTDY